MIHTMQRIVPRSLSGQPVMTYALIGTCCAVFLLSPAAGFISGYGSDDAVRHAQVAYFRHWGVRPETLWSGALRPLFTPFTAVFLHGNWMHLLGNLLFLFVFGGMVEGRMGALRFTGCYLVIGYAAMLSYAAVHPHSSQTLVGASGAISGVLGAFLYLFPRARVTGVYPFLFFLPLRFPAWAVLVFWISLQWLAARADTDGPGTAHLTHVIGFALGFLYTWARFRGEVRVSRPAQATERGPKP
ncbi:rhomboid family intramembrane serine protease [Streptomyces gobiensis]|uniref:rhomboid family intramembrane serine protease n=1 Tax=Streptomyces gobiensis TaxID=2875706 RepID=UPI001E2B67EB|nr:rhomboid family intramembrane serine protease [Streptomyces gobiensis]UGY90927.1 rhomboid family intramembrane serine protease [Streptomyces gobiensis]